MIKKFKVLILFISGLLLGGQSAAQQWEDVSGEQLQKIIKGKDGFYVLHYVIKRGDMGTDKRTQWLKNLKASHPK